MGKAQRQKMASTGSFTTRSFRYEPDFERAFKAVKPAGDKVVRGEVKNYNLHFVDPVGTTQPIAMSLDNTRVLEILAIEGVVPSLLPCTLGSSGIILLRDPDISPRYFKTPMFMYTLSCGSRFALLTEGVPESWSVYGMEALQKMSKRGELLDSDISRLLSEGRLSCMFLSMHWLRYHLVQKGTKTPYTLDIMMTGKYGLSVQNNLTGKITHNLGRTPKVWAKLLDEHAHKCLTSRADAQLVNPYTGVAQTVSGTYCPKTGKWLNKYQLLRATPVYENGIYIGYKQTVPDWYWTRPKLPPVLTYDEWVETWQKKGVSDDK